ncbi:MAG: radical SAM protein [Defluviitaleaceae bacterium]|nr:radical SAM protein [Defluviitaleaceae bacterium]MCL2835317.1 radical SAM protein [Defluviitaleaceae bacterium]
MKTGLSKYMDIKRIEFIVTWQCGGKCKHCQIGGEINKPGSHHHVLSDYAAEAVRKLSAAYDITSVMTFGGEPLYYPEVTAAIHKTAAVCGINARQIITNGYFTNSAEKSGLVARALADAGVNNIMLSVDAFHQEHIPIEPVYQFAKDITEAQIPGVFLHPAWLVDEEHENPYNAGTKEILERFSGLNIAAGQGNNVFLGGNSARYLREYFDVSEINLGLKCGFAPHTEPLTEISSLTIVPNGDVMICGFSIGNIYIEDIMDVVLRYNPYEHCGMRAVINGGVSELLNCAAANEIMIDTSGYYSACDICHAVAKCFNRG